MRRATFLVAGLLLSASCRTAPTAVPLPPDDPRPRVLVEGWNAAAQERVALRGGARLAVDGDAAGLRIRSRQRMALERPGRMRVELLGFLDQTLGVLATDGRDFDFFRAEDRSFQSGPVHEGLLWEYAYLDLTVDEAVDLLLGAPILDPTLRTAGAFDLGGGAVRLDLADEAGVVRERVEFDAAARLTGLEVRGADGRTRWRARFADYRPVGDTAVAHELVLDVAAGRTHAEISLRDVELNPDLPEGIFRLRAARAHGPAASP